MGVVTGILLLPVTGPVKALRFLLERLRDEAEAVLRDEGRAFAELIDLSMRHSAGQLSDAEYAEQEAELLGRLNTIREERSALSREMAEDYEDRYEDDDEDGQEDGWQELSDREPAEEEVW